MTSENGTFRTAPSPSWMCEALATPCERESFKFEGVELEVLGWGRHGDPGVLLVHGFGASADWWAFTAPFLSRGQRVVAFSFSGNGRSGWRDSYSIEIYKREALACAKFHGALDGGPMAIVAHSFGATAGARAACTLGADLRAFIVLDRAIEQDKLRRTDPSSPRISHLFSSEFEAIGHFKTKPSPWYIEPAILDYVARNAVRRATPDTSAWTWRQDPDFRHKLNDRQPSIAAELQQMFCPKAFLRGTHSSLFTTQEAEIVRSSGMGLIEIPCAGHHLMLEQPIATSVAISTVLQAGQSA